MKHVIRLSLLAVALVSLMSGFAYAQTPTPAPTTKTKWTVSEVLAERKIGVADVRHPRYCQGGVFKPCVCASNVTKLVQYRPSVKECSGRAAIVLSGRYTSAFSAVVRDRENKDRWPPQGINGCSAYQRDVLGLNKCSAFKAQKIIATENDDGPAKVHCLGASGSSPLFKRVSRITIKLADSPTSSHDPIARLCLAGPKKPLN
jgi:hypothetical protein